MALINNRVIPITKTNQDQCTKNKTKTSKPKRWQSPTSINAYLRCPRKFYNSKIAKLKGKPSIHLLRGDAVHKAVEKFYKFRFNRCSNMEYSDLRSAALDLFKDEWDAKKKGLLELKLTEDELTFFEKDSEKMIINFLDDFIASHGFEKPNPEVEKTLFIPDLKLVVRIDKIESEDGKPTICDFKTSKSMELTDDYLRQMGICALAYKHKYGKTPDAQVHFLKFQEGRMPVKILEPLIQEMEELINDIHHKTQSDDIEDYPCTCGWCENEFGIKHKKWNASMKS